ncbi:MAG TPA: Wzz/FepE/Etk N-terminal domain-containing protein [Thermoanaerobaculia bacterium]|nr:Wzz/FepE/Etk N-terminal domain-containing protein [Thermoanaerobaculia bacterium]
MDPSARNLGGSDHDLRNGASPRALLAVLRRRKLAVLIPTILLAVGGAIVAHLLPPRYRAEALLQSEPRVSRSAVMSPSPALDVQGQLARIADVLYRPSLLEQVIREFDLYPEVGRITEDELEQLRDRIVLRVESERMFSLGFVDQDQERVARVAWRLAELVVQETGAERKESAEATAAFLGQQIATIESRLEEQSRRIEEYRNRWSAEIPEQVPTTLKLLESVQERLQRSSEALLELSSRRAAILSEMQELESEGFSRDPGQARLEELRLELRQLRRRYKDEHPDVVKARMELEELETAVANGSLGAAAPEYTGARMRLMQLRAELEGVDQRIARGAPEQTSLIGNSSAYQRRIEAAPRHEMAIAAMTREYDDTRTQYVTLLAQLNEARLYEQLEKTRQASMLRIVEPPRVPSEPFAPNRIRIALMGLAAGLGVGFALAFLVEQGDRSFRDVEELEASMNLRVLATIPSMDRGERRRAARGSTPSVAYLDEPNGPAAEQYRMLATRLVHGAGPGRSTSVLVTSPMIGEGKTTTAVNLALTLAGLVTESVLLIDGDLGRPNVHRLLQLPSGPGLGELLTGPQREPDRMLRWHQGLHVLTAGRTSPHTRMALGSRRGQELFDQLRGQFAYVVVDAPPILAVADTLALQGMVESILLVLRSGVTPREAARRALQGLDQARLIGIVMSDVEAAETYAGSYPYYTAEPDEHVLAAGRSASA